jgi:hypothetical protein
MTKSPDRQTGKSAFMDGMWAAFVDWAFRMDDMRKAFESETGEVFPALAATPLDAMIDNACGFDRKTALKVYCERFTNWVTINHWGYEDAPEKWRKAHPR